MKDIASMNFKYFFDAFVDSIEREVGRIDSFDSQKGKRNIYD